MDMMFGLVMNNFVNSSRLACCSDDIMMDDVWDRTNFFSCDFFNQNIQES